MSKTIQSRIQHSVYTAAVLKAKNPVLLKGEVVYESDTCKYKIGDGSTAWNTLPYGGGNFEGPISAADITQDTTHRFVTDTEKTTWNGKASTAVATQSANGLMSAADKKKLDGITDDILSLPGEGYEEVEIVDQVSISASGVMVKVVPGFVLFIIKSVQFGGLKTAKFTLPGFIIGSVLTPAAFRAPGGTCTTIYISTSTDKTNKCSNIMFSGVDNAGEVTAPLTFAIQATSFSRE